MTRPLITPADVAVQLESETPPLLLDVRWVLSVSLEPGQRGSDIGRAQYLDGHLPGAVWVDLDADLAGPAGEGGRHPLPDPAAFQTAMRAAGVTDGRAVVAYDGINGMAAARLWWLLTDGGKTDVTVMDGGYAAWVAAGYPVEDGDVRTEPGDVTLTPGQRPRVDVDSVQQHLASGGAVWDVRAADRYRGENETVDPVAGHIPGAGNIPVGTFTGPDGFADEAELRAGLGDVRTGDVMSCGSGITASAGILAAESVGIHGVALYPGSWSEWIRDPGRPVATGPNP